jgi:hypothetical protein
MSDFLRFIFIMTFTALTLQLCFELKEIASAIRERNAAPAYADDIGYGARCTTDTDCMERFGGSGGPEPLPL